MMGAILGGFTILGVFLTVGAWVNGRSIKKFLAEEERMTRKMMDEGFKKMDEGFKKMDEGFKLIARLIVEENERTRKEILAALAK